MTERITRQDKIAAADLLKPFLDFVEMPSQRVTRYIDDYGIATSCTVGSIPSYADEKKCRLDWLRDTGAITYNLEEGDFGSLTGGVYKISLLDSRKIIDAISSYAPPEAAMGIIRRQEAGVKENRERAEQERLASHGIGQTSIKPDSPDLNRTGVERDASSQ